MPPTTAGGQPAAPRGSDPGSPTPIRRERVGRGSYEDPADKRRPGKTGRPGQ